jgi:hypothetical protein
VPGGGNVLFERDNARVYTEHDKATTTPPTPMITIYGRHGAGL